MPSGMVVKGYDALSYDEACIYHAAIQGLGPPALLLSYAGWKPELWQSGGFTMVLVIKVRESEIWVTWDGDPDEYTLGLYTAESLEESTEAVAYENAGLGSLLEAVEALAADAPA